MKVYCFVVRRRTSRRGNLVKGADQGQYCLISQIARNNKIISNVRVPRLGVVYQQALCTGKQEIKIFNDVTTRYCLNRHHHEFISDVDPLFNYVKDTLPIVKLQAL